MRSAIVEFFRSQRRPLTIREVAAATGLHANTVRFHLERLVQDGTLRQESGAAVGRGRPATRYVLAPSGGRSGARNYELLARMLLTHLATEDDPAGAATRAGEQWGRQLAQSPAPGTRPSAEEALDALGDVLTDLGFDPRVADPSEPLPRLELRHCPFLELAQTQGNLVCRMHHGLLQGAFAQGRAPLRVRSLQPFVEPTTCVAHLRSVAPRRAKSES